MVDKIKNWICVAIVVTFLMAQCLFIVFLTVTQSPWYIIALIAFVSLVITSFFLGGVEQNNCIAISFAIFLVCLYRYSAPFVSDFVLSLIENL